MREWLQQCRAAMRTDERALERAWGAAPRGPDATEWEVAWRAAAVDDLRAEGAFERAAWHLTDRADAGCHVSEEDYPAVPDSSRRRLLRLRASGAPAPHPPVRSSSTASSGRGAAAASVDPWAASPGWGGQPSDPRTGAADPDARHSYTPGRPGASTPEDRRSAGFHAVGAANTPWWPQSMRR